MGNNGRAHSPLRYPGGKGKVTNYFKLLLLENDLLGVEYVEPYAGGASVALTLLYEEYVGSVHINDLNPGVHAFWHAVLYQTDELCRRIDATDVTMAEWFRQREVYRSTDPVDPLDLAFAVFFLNRTNRSGIIAGGVIGGLDQTGPWKLDARYNKPDLIGRIRKAGRHRDRITLSNLDALQLLEHWAAREDAGFLYLDPPYYVKGEGLYDNFYTADDHAKIATAVQRLKHPWVVSYDNAPAISALYAEVRLTTYQLSYSAQERQFGSEAMFYANGLVIPQQQPACIPTKVVDRARTSILF